MFYNVSLPIFKHVKDLEVVRNADLKFDQYIFTNKKANVMVDLIPRSLSYFDSPLFKKLFTAFVRPHLELGPVSSILKKHTNTHKNVHCCCTKLLDGY